MQLKTIHTALAPNYTWREVSTSLYMLICPWNWPSMRYGRSIGELEKTFENRLEAKYTVAVGSGREALQLILQALDFPKGSEVILQSFTCMVVVNAILWAGFKPVYVDIDETYNLDYQDLEKKINDKTIAIIVQHTFGIPAKIEKIKSIAQNKGVLLIEDCAHALGAKYEKQEVGTFGDIAFFSFGRSKVISSVNGGLVAVHKQDLLPSFLAQKKHLHNWPLGRILQNLLHAPITALAKFFYSIVLGKVIMVAAQKLRLINLEVTPEEKSSTAPCFFPSRIANSMAKLALLQMKQLDKFNQHRKHIAKYYFQHLQFKDKVDPQTFPGAIFLRYPVQVESPKELLKFTKKAGIILGDWYSSPVAPVDIDQSKTGYQLGSCPHCETANKRIINLPTHYDLRPKDLSRIVKLLNTYDPN